MTLLVSGGCHIFVYRLLAVTVLMAGLFFIGFKNTAAQEPVKPPGEAVAKADDKQSADTKKTEPGSKIKVTFDDTTPGVVYVESNGEKIRVDTAKKSFEEVATNSDEPAAPDDDKTAKAAATPDDKNAGKYDFDRSEEPFDYRVVNIPTPKRIPKGSWNLVFSHRFSQPVKPLHESAENLLGLDSFSVSSFGIIYGITDKLYVSASRSPVCQRGLCRVIEIGAGYNWIAADKDSRIGLTTYASVEGNDNFTEEYTYNLQAMLSGRIGKRVYLFFSPALHINSNGQRRFDPRPTDFFPPAPIADTFHLPTHGASFGFGASVLITPNVAALFDFSPRAGFKLGQVHPIFNSTFQIIGFRNESEPTLGFGIQRNIGRHAFSLTFSNTQTTTTSRYNSSNLGYSPKHFTIGFNLSRRFGGQ
jgi:hypothetical protein